MWLIFILLLLPFIYVFSWALAPVAYVIGRNFHFAERLHVTFGGWSAWLFFMVLIVLVVYCGKSKWFFWLGLVPVLAIGTWLGGWN